MFEKPYSLETNPDTISRVVVGSKGIMPSDAGMKPPKRTELSSPEIETDLIRDPKPFAGARRRKLGIPLVAKTECSR
jgi:hypothetical protein